MNQTFTENKAYNEYLYKIIHAWNPNKLEQLKWEIVLDERITTFDEVNDLIRRATKQQSILAPIIEEKIK